MDPVSALSIACAITQFVEFGVKTVAIYQDVARKGQTGQNKDLEERIIRLKDLHRSIKLRSKFDSLPELEDARQKCSDTAEELLKVLEKTKADSQTSKPLGSLLTTYKTIKYGSRIDRIRLKLEAYQTELDSHLLLDVRRKIDFAAVQRTEAFKSLQADYKELITRLADGQTTLAELVSTENGLTRERIKNEFDKAKETARRQKILDSLFFPEIWARQEQIDPAHKATFRWVLNRNHEKWQQTSWDNLPAWLSSNDAMFWINGKAGSGKSTLMSFICEEQPTVEEHLQEWSGQQPVTIIKFFFHKSGAELQRTIKGLLRSCLYQVFSKLKAEEWYELAQKDEFDESEYPDTNSMPEWTQPRLVTLMKSLLLTTQRSFCFVIDGLDEFSGTQGDTVSLLKFLVELSTLRNIKLCVSSRPEILFEQHLGKYPSLRLQELTADDIDVYIMQRFQERFADRNDLGMFQELVRKRALGVFVWVKLTVESLLEGMQNHDTAGQLEERLKEIPPELDDLYAAMLGSLRPAYKKDAGILFGLAKRTANSRVVVVLGPHFQAVDVSFIIFVFAADVALERKSDWSKLSSKACLEATTNLRQAVNVLLKSRCLGLVETQRQEKVGDLIPIKSAGATKFHPNDLPLELQEMMQTSVHFLHRTVHDFIFESTQDKPVVLEVPSEDTLSIWRIEGIFRLLMVLDTITDGAWKNDEQQTALVMACLRKALQWTSQYYLYPKDRIFAILDTLASRFQLPRTDLRYELVGVEEMTRIDELRKQQGLVDFEFLLQSALSGGVRWVTRRLLSSQTPEGRLERDLLMMLTITENNRLVSRFRNLKLVEVLLKNGSDPNRGWPYASPDLWINTNAKLQMRRLMLAPYTPWTVFLFHLTQTSRFRDAEGSRSNTSYERLMYFLDAGAEVKVKLNDCVCVYKHSHNNASVAEMRLYREWPVVELLRYSLGEHPQWNKLVQRLGFPSSQSTTPRRTCYIERVFWYVQPAGGGKKNLTLVHDDTGMGRLPISNAQLESIEAESKTKDMRLQMEAVFAECQQDRLLEANVSQTAGLEIS